MRILEVFGHFLKKFVWKMAPMGLIFRPQIGQYIRFRLFSWNASAKKRGPRGPIFGPFWASKWVKIQVFEYFVKNFALYSRQSCFICALELLSEMCKICASKAQFLGHFGPQSKTNFWCLVTFKKTSHWFHNSIASHAHSKYFYICGEYGPQRPNFWATLGPQISQNAGLRSFSQRFSTSFAPVLVYMSIWATFRGVLNIDPRGPISRSFWSPK